MAIVALDRGDGVADGDPAHRTGTRSCRATGTGVETVLPSLTSVAGTAVHARMPLMPSGVFQAETFLKACLPKFKRVGPDRRVQVGVGGVAVGVGQGGPVAEGRGHQGVRTGDDRRRHRGADLGERQGVDDAGNVGRPRCRSSSSEVLGDVDGGPGEGRYVEGRRGEVGRGAPVDGTGIRSTQIQVGRGEQLGVGVEPGAVVRGPPVPPVPPLLLGSELAVPPIVRLEPKSKIGPERLRDDARRRIDRRGRGCRR